MRLSQYFFSTIVAIGFYGMASSATGSQPVEFSRDVLPILSDRCFHCHGPDEDHREADLRLDDRESAVEASEVVVPSAPDQSELMARILSDDADVVMPPPAANRKPLTKKEIETLRQWIAEGAVWGKHWSFEKPVRPQLPPSNRNPIDVMIQNRLEQEGLQPSPAADKRTLIRRVTLDLIGFPPTPEEIDAFLKDDSADAYLKLVDRLLHSPHYGERMAWPWLDAARYADTSGYQGDPVRSMWPWRDWVVNALNNNMPFDQFTIEQLAGDLLENATPEQRLATGFNRNHMHNGEGGRIAEETRIDNVFDRAETTGTVWLGLTLQCARCHDHKFDPTSNHDYFAFLDFFNQTTENGGINGSLAVPPAIDFLASEVRAQIDPLNSEIESLTNEILTPAPSEEETQWLASWSDRKTESWKSMDPIEFRSTGGATITKREDRSLHVSGKRPENDTYEIQLQCETSSITGIQLEAFVDPESPGKGTGRDEKGNFVLSEIECFVRSAETPNAEPVKVKFVRAEADVSQSGFPVSGAIDGDKSRSKGWAVNGHLEKSPRSAKFFLESPVAFSKGTILNIKLHFESEHRWHTLALFRLSATDEKIPTGVDTKISELLLKPSSARNDKERQQLQLHFRRYHSQSFVELGKKLEDKQSELAELQSRDQPVKVMVMDTISKPRETFVLIKGIYNDVTEKKVTANVPSMLPPLAGKPSGGAYNRLDLARWIVSPENPLTARVTVNRYWQTFFGRGIVSTPYDFGLQGTQPTHPDLLDWLAVEFVESGWDVKHVHRLIVTSKTYQQSARMTPELLEVDPENLLLARAPRYRMPSWMIRDQALVASGLIQRSVGGPPVKPYQPDGIWAEATFGKVRYQADTGNKLYRRSLYTFWRRIVGPTVFFDSAKRQTCEVKPNLTNTPLHALTTLNDVTYVETARVLAEGVLKHNASREEQIKEAFIRLTSRLPHDDEMRLLVNRLESNELQFRSSPEDAKALIQMGDAPVDESVDPAKLAAMTALINILQNLDEVLVNP